MITPKLEQALQVAATVHRLQLRKATGIPYITHPVSVMLIAARVTTDEDTLCACLLHDVREDGDPKQYSEQDMRRDFGPKVTAIVEAVTKDAELKDWRARNEDYLKNLQATDIQPALLVCAADKIHNLSSMLGDYEQVGDTLWSRFNAGKDAQKWWYRSVLAMLKTRSPRNPLVNDLSDLVSKLETL